MQVDTMEDAAAINGYLNNVHEMVSEAYAKQNIDGIKEQPERLRCTTLSEDARKGDTRGKVHSADICRIGEMGLYDQPDFVPSQGGGGRSCPECL